MCTSRELEFEPVLSAVPGLADRLDKEADRENDTLLDFQLRTDSTSPRGLSANRTELVTLGVGLFRSKSALMPSIPEPTYNER